MDDHRPPTALPAVRRRTSLRRPPSRGIWRAVPAVMALAGVFVLVRTLGLREQLGS